MGRRSGRRLVRLENSSLQRPLTTRRLLRSALGQQLLLSHSAVGRCGPARHLPLDDAGPWRSAHCCPIAKARSTSPRSPTISAQTTSGPSRGCCRPLAGGRRTRLCRIGLHPTNHGCVLPAIQFPTLGNLHPVLLVSTGSIRRPRQPLLGLRELLPSHDRLLVWIHPSTGRAFG